MPSLLFVCQANIARSASAELIARHLLGTGGAWHVASAGVSALVGHGVDSELAGALHRRGIDASAHTARQVDLALLSSADLVLAFEARQRAWVLKESPASVRSTFTIRRAARALQGLPRRAEPLSFLAVDDAPYVDADDFADPYGHGPAAAESAVAEIAELLEVILAAVGATPSAAGSRGERMLHGAPPGALL
jgi:protein-tyrosine phosphatase